jgi:protein gp37
VLRWDSESADAIAEGVLLDKNIRRARVFCASLADWLDDEIPIEWLCDLLALIRRTPNLDWLLLTKRPENFRPRLIKAYVEPAASADTLWVQDWTNGSVYDNIWVGTTVEDQNRAPGRIAALKAIPATVHFLSCEPLLEEIGIQFELKGIDWVICGGESGPGARPMNPMWAQDLMCQCKVERVPFFMKQLGGVTDKRHRLDQLPEYLRVRQFP